MKYLVIAEKPSVGKDIAKALNAKNAKNGYIEGDKYVVTWALGHLVTLADPEDYNARYKTWNLEDLPIIPTDFKLTVLPKTRKQFQTVKELIYRKDISTIIIATDAGREGELVARLILEKLNCKKPILRLWISSVTEKAIKDGFNNLKDGKLYNNLASCAKARAVADWIVGINATRCLTAKYDISLSCGRVQTPTVSIINKREEEIKNFKPVKYFGLTAKGDNINFNWVSENSNTRCFDEKQIKNIFSSISSEKEADITDVSKTQKKKYPNKLYDLTSLQRDSYNRYGFSPKETLSIMQKLYEHHKVLTYPRTDSKYISDDIIKTIPLRLKNINARPYDAISQDILKKPIIANSNFVDNKKVTDHHAIIPTEQSLKDAKLSDKERKIYDLVVMRFLAVLLEPLEYEQITVKAKIGKETFVSKGRVVLKAGFTKIAKETKDEDDEDFLNLKDIAKGKKIQIKQIKLNENFTKPPSLLTEATLLMAMENPHQFFHIEDKDLEEMLSETNGLGTVATRADIIHKLFETGLIEKVGAGIVATEKAKQLLNLTPDAMKSPEMTGKWEQMLSLISSGSLSSEKFLKDIKNFTFEIIGEIKNSKKEFDFTNISQEISQKEVKYLMNKINNESNKTTENSKISEALKGLKF